MSLDVDSKLVFLFLDAREGLEQISVPQSEQCQTP